MKKEKSIKVQLTDWIYKQYDITFLPKYFFINLDKVYKGTYKNLKKAVPVEDLFDMWQRKMDFLNKTAERNRQLGKEMLGMSRISYDLAILLSKYDSYLEWKKKTASDENSTALDTNILKICNSTPAFKEKNKKQIDISSIIDEI